MIFVNQGAGVVVGLRQSHQIARQVFQAKLDLLGFVDRSHLLFPQPLAVYTGLVSDPPLPAEDGDHADGEQEERKETAVVKSIGLWRGLRHRDQLSVISYREVRGRPLLPGSWSRRGIFSQRESVAGKQIA
jgi:hypothetical protein